jgi:hypothetical protein
MATSTAFGRVVSLQVSNRTPTTWKRTAGGVVGTGSLGLVAWFAAPVVSLIVAMVALALVMGIALSRGREQRACRRERRRRIAARRWKLRQVGALRAHQYEELQELVESCEPSAVDRFDLEGLLDQFAALAQAHGRHAKAVELAACDDKAPERARSPLSKQIRLRREEYRAACLRETEQLADDLEAVDELVRFVVQRVMAPPPGPRIEHELDRRLADLDEVDHAQEDLARSFS